MSTPALVRLASVLALAAAGTASAQIIFDSAGFESPAYSVGALNGQNGWAASTAPGSAAIVDLGGNQVVQVTGGSTNWFYPSLNYTPAPGTLVVIEADISRTMGTPTPSFGYSIDVYSPNNRLARFGLTTSSGLIRPFVTSRFSSGLPNPSGTVGNVLAGSASFAADEFVHFEATLNFATQTFRLAVNTVDLGFDFPFTTAAGTLSDADFQVSSTSGQNDYGRLDNYLVYATAVPEPSACAALAGLAALALGMNRRRR